MKSSEQHFDNLASDYDYWKKKNYYYHQNLIALYRELIPATQSVLEIGCGTGDILARLDPVTGRGIDLSAEMAALAKTKYQNRVNLTFGREDIFDSTAAFSYDTIFLADVLEHVPNLPDFLKQLARRTPVGSQVIISVANPFWEPVLMLAEKFKMKMPEGPHQRFSLIQTEEFFKMAGFMVEKQDYRLLVPKKLPASDWLNRVFYKIPLLRQFGFIVFWVLKKN